MALGWMIIESILPLIVCAQNNPYKISDKLYPIYKEAYQNRYKLEGMRLSDSLHTAATKYGDKKAECLALTIPMYYYQDNEVQTNIEEAANTLRDVSRANNYLQYYYFAWSMQVNYYLRQEKYMLALRAAETMKNDAAKDKNEYGFYLGLRTLGTIYSTRNNRTMALQYFKEAVEYQKEHLPEQDPAQSYIKIATLTMELYPEQATKQALAYMEEAIKTAKTENIRTEAFVWRCSLFNPHTEPQKFETAYQQMEERLKQYPYPENSSSLLKVRITRCLLHQEFEQAHTYAQRLPNALRLDFQARIYAAEGDYQKAFYYRNQILFNKDSLDNQMQLRDIAELNAQMGNDRLKLENAQLDLKNADLEMDKLHAQVELERSNAENSQLMLDNRNLEVKRLTAESELQKSETAKQRMETERQKALLEQQRATEHYRTFMFSSVIVFLLLSVFALVFYLYRRHKTMAFLKEKNEELLVARDQAEAANKMKTMFIQNMSHEIRTPLNAIVGFSSLILDPNMELSKEEEQEFGELIQHNSDLLTTLVNDILRLAELESGKYIIQSAACCCNEMCQTAIATVSHRRPEEVKLYYTSEVEDAYQIITDKQRVEQVLINFLTNAEKHTLKGEIHLHCSLSENPGRVTFSVSDTGTGIPAEQAEAIFERFKKLDNFQQGTGLGLNICRLIAERLNGTVKLDSTYTGGARFLFILPIDGSFSANNTEQD